MDTKSNNSNQFDISAYRVTQNYGDTLGSKKVITTANVSKPTKGRFFRTSDDPDCIANVYILEDKTEGTYHLTSPEVAAVLGNLVRPTSLYLAVDRADNPFLIPVPLPSENGTRNPWHQSMLNAIEAAKKDWVRIEADKSAGMYQTFVALGELPEPTWPDMSMDELLQLAFAGRTIDNTDNPKVQMAMGRI
jgi:hypothetical protein